MNSAVISAIGFTQKPCRVKSKIYNNLIGKRDTLKIRKFFFISIQIDNIIFNCIVCFISWTLDINSDKNVEKMFILYLIFRVQNYYVQISLCTPYILASQRSFFYFWLISLEPMDRLKRKTLLRVKEAAMHITWFGQFLGPIQTPFRDLQYFLLVFIIVNIKSLKFKYGMRGWCK